MREFVDVYRFVCDVGGLRIAPGYVQGTLEAIERLGSCSPVPDSGTWCHRTLLEDGFLFAE